MASNDVYGYDRSTPAGVLTTKGTIFSVSGASLPALVQQWAVQYQQALEEIFELGSSNVYWKKGRPVGSGSIDRLVGVKGSSGSSDVRAAFKGMLNLCDKGASMTFNIGNNTCDGGEQLSIVVGGAVISDITYGAQAANHQVAQGVRFRFASMS